MPAQRWRRRSTASSAAYEAQPELVAEQRGWNPVIALPASDAPARVVVSLDDGRVARVGAAGAARRWRSPAASTRCATSSTLRRDPNEPYLFGELVVVGAEADFVRLDYIASRLCPR